jgi:hypothetical protein
MQPNRPKGLAVARQCLPLLGRAVHGVPALSVAQVQQRRAYPSGGPRP